MAKIVNALLEDDVLASCSGLGRPASRSALGLRRRRQCLSRQDYRGGDCCSCASRGTWKGVRRVRRWMVLMRESRARQRGWTTSGGIPGTELRQYPIDDAWLLRKHKDNLADFTDVEPAEKEYMQEWDGYVLQKNLSSPQFLPRTFSDSSATRRRGSSRAKVVLTNLTSACRSCWRSS